MASEADEFAHTVTRQAVAHVCMAIGLEQAQPAALDTMADVVGKFIESVGVQARDAAERNGRGTVNLLDVLTSFQAQPQPISWRDLKEFSFADGAGCEQSWEQDFPHSVPLFPVSESRREAAAAAQEALQEEKTAAEVEGGRERQRREGVEEGMGEGAKEGNGGSSAAAGGGRRGVKRRFGVELGGRGGAATPGGEETGSGSAAGGGGEDHGESTRPDFLRHLPPFPPRHTYIKEKGTDAKGRKAKEKELAQLRKAKLERKQQASVAVRRMTSKTASAPAAAEAGRVAAKAGVAPGGEGVAGRSSSSRFGDLFSDGGGVRRFGPRPPKDAVASAFTAFGVRGNGSSAPVPVPAELVGTGDKNFRIREGLPLSRDMNE